MDALFNAVRCIECGQEMEANLFTVECQACGSPWLNAEYDLASLPEHWTERVSRRPTNLWRYRELLPFALDFQPVSMSEGWTPLIRAERLEQEGDFDRGQIWIKDERRQPTSSFKDREASFAVSAVKAQEIKELVLSSTGNKAAAYAAYCARAGIKLWVFLPSNVPAEKMRELGLYGAEVIKVTGTYDQTKEVAADFAARHGIYLDKGAKAIPGKEGMKTIALEIAEQLGLVLGPPDLAVKPWRAPDWYIQSVSGGIGPMGVIKGFVELHRAGLIDRVPKLGIVQAEGCSPMVKAWEKGLDQAEPVRPDTLIAVLATGKPGFGYEILKGATDQYGGAMVAVNDGEAFRAMRHIARTEGFSVEPASSVAFAGLNKLLAAYIQPEECVVVNCSGHTFSAEKHALEDQYALHLKIEAGAPSAAMAPDAGLDLPKESLVAALEQLDEQITTIVIIEDNPHHSRLVRRLLQNYKHYRIFEAYNGLDGIDLVRQRQPDLVILDLTLPDMDGFSILEVLKADERTREIPIVIISAKSLSSDEWGFLRQQTQSVWQKGRFSARDLVGHVVDVLGDDIELLEMQPQTIPAETFEDEEAIESFDQSHQPCILVVDDFVADARMMRRLFEARQRFDVIEAYTAETALAVLDQTRPDLIILDLILPDIDGETLLGMIRERRETQDVPVVIVTGKDIDSSLRSRLAGLEVDSIWSKGMLDRNSLLNHVETVLSE